MSFLAAHKDAQRRGFIAKQMNGSLVGGELARVVVDHRIETLTRHQKKPWQ